MVRIIVIIAAIASGPMLIGQTNTQASISVVPAPNRAFDAVKQNLGLTDFQTEQLVKIMQEKSAALLETYKQIGAKEEEMQTLLNSGSQDTNRIGQSMIQIYKLQTQPLPANNQYRQRALAVLTADQKVKLGLLEQALLLNTPASQAATLNLIDGPAAQILPVFPRVMQPLPPVRFQR